MNDAARLSWSSARAREIIRQLNDDNQWKVTANCSRFAAFEKRVITLYVYATYVVACITLHASRMSLPLQKVSFALGLARS